MREEIGIGVEVVTLKGIVYPDKSISRSDSRCARPATRLDIKTSTLLCLDAWRTTLTLDDDVAAVLERLRTTRGTSLKDLVNEALRRGLKDMSSRTKQRERLRTRSVALGQLRIAGLDNVGEALVITEGEAHK